MTKSLEYFFSIGSPWSYIGLDAFTDIARRHEVEIEPFLTTVIEENGGIFSRNRPEIRRAYWMRDLKRWAKVRGKTNGRGSLGLTRNHSPRMCCSPILLSRMRVRSWARVSIVARDASAIPASASTVPN